MMEYKVCFHLSYHCPWAFANATLKNGKKSKATKGHGKWHYSGNSLEECVEKFKTGFYRGDENTKCTSMWVMRGRERGLNIKWEDYKEGI